MVVCKELDNVVDIEDKVYFTIGLNNVSFSLWYNCRYFGMLEVPLGFLCEEPVNIELAVSDSANRETRINITSLLLCKSYRESFINWANNNVESRESGNKAFGEVNVSINFVENSICVISLKEGVWIEKVSVLLFGSYIVYIKCTSIR